MKSFFIIFTFALLFFGCADKNAFSKFKMLPVQELSASNLQSSKIKRGDNIDGIVSVIYLNKVYPDTYNINEYFYVYLYLKDKKEILNSNKFDKVKFIIKLNSKLPIKIQELPHDNKFSHLSSLRSEWRRYFLVSFKQAKKSELSFVLESGQSSSDELVYQKDEQ